MHTHTQTNNIVHNILLWAFPPLKHKPQRQNHLHTAKQSDDKQLQQELHRLAPCDLEAVVAAMACCTKGIDAQLQAMVHLSTAPPPDALPAALLKLSDAVAYAMATGAALYSDGRADLELEGLQPADLGHQKFQAALLPSFRLPVSAVLAGAHDDAGGEQHADQEASRSVVMQHLLAMPAAQLRAMFGEVQLRTVLLYVLGLQECVEELAERVQELMNAMIAAGCI